VYRLPITIIETVDRNLMQAAGFFKINYRVSLADSIALALAQQLDVRLVSTDHHEFDTIEQAGIIKFMWLR
jgi:predicted nucleic acid-binding protein